MPDAVTKKTNNPVLALHVWKTTNIAQQPLPDWPKPLYIAVDINDVQMNCHTDMTTARNLSSTVISRQLLLHNYRNGNYKEYRRRRSLYK